MRRATPAQQFGAVISERAPETRDLAASQELEKFLRAMGLYENDTGSRRRKVGRDVSASSSSLCFVACLRFSRRSQSGGEAGRGICCVDKGSEGRK